MRKIGGLDFSLTKSGVAVATRRVDGTVIMNTITVRSTGHVADTLPMSDRRVSKLADEICHCLGTCDLVVTEGVIPGRGRLFELYWGRGTVLHRLMRLGVPIAVVSPDSMKRALTGKTARQLGADQSKWAVANAIRKLWPDLEPANDNESDAAALCHLGAVALDWSVITLERHRQVKWTEWPEFGPGTVLEAQGRG